MGATSETRSLPGRTTSGEELLRVGGSVKVLAIVVIVLLSLEVGVLALQQRPDGEGLLRSALFRKGRLA
jgi:hypothetical protein